MLNNFADKIIDLNKKLNYIGSLPKGFQVLNPFFDNPETIQVMTQFHQKFYNDQNERKFIIGINSSRNGAGVTGIPFTDTKRLKSECGIVMKSATFIQKLNKETSLFKKLIVLDHPRFIQQYKSKDRQFYIDKYLLALN